MVTAENTTQTGNIKCRQEDYLIREILVYGGVVWIRLAEDGVLWEACVNTIMELMIQTREGKFLKS
jgi:hypothetical protein